MRYGQPNSLTADLEEAQTEARCAATLGHTEAADFMEALLTALVDMDVPDRTVVLSGRAENGDFFVTFAEPHRRLTFILSRDGVDSSWHTVTRQSHGGAVRSGLLKQGVVLHEILSTHFNPCEGTP